MTEAEHMIDWLWRKYPNQPVRCATMIRILCNRERR